MHINAALAKQLGERVGEYYVLIEMHMNAVRHLPAPILEHLHAEAAREWKEIFTEFGHTDNPELQLEFCDRWCKCDTPGDPKRPIIAFHAAFFAVQTFGQIDAMTNLSGSDLTKVRQYGAEYFQEIMCRPDGRSRVLGSTYPITFLDAQSLDASRGDITADVTVPLGPFVRAPVALSSFHDFYGFEVGEMFPYKVDRSKKEPKFSVFTIVAYTKRPDDEYFLVTHNDNPAEEIRMSLEEMEGIRDQYEELDAKGELDEYYATCEHFQ